MLTLDVENVTVRYSHWFTEKSIALACVGPPHPVEARLFPNAFSVTEDHRFVDVADVPYPAPKQEMMIRPITDPDEYDVHVNADAATRVVPPIVLDAVFSPAVNVAVVAEPCPDKMTAKSAAATCPVRPCWKNPPGNRGCWFFPDAAAIRFCAAEDDAFAVGYANPLAKSTSDWVPV